MDFIKSPLNYTGNKYNLLEQIIPLLPKDINTFVDCCGGSFTVGANVNANITIYNEVNKMIFNLVQEISITNIEEFNNQIEEKIKKYNLEKGNKETYYYFRDNIFKNDKSALNLYILICFAFNYSIRFNKEGHFNIPCGNRGYSESMKNNLFKFNEQVKSKNVEFLSMDFKLLPINRQCFYYIDPPYLPTITTYTENNLWNIEKEKEMYEWLDKLNEEDIKFALSNVIIYRGEENRILLEWANKYNIHNLNYQYKNNNRFKKDNSLITQEVLITNY